MVQNEDKVNHPSHYTWLKEKCGIEVIDITRHLGFCLGNAVKYLLRCGHKSEEGYTQDEKTVEDLNKAIFYIKDEIAQITGKKEDWEAAYKKLEKIYNSFLASYRALTRELDDLKKVRVRRQVRLGASELGTLINNIDGKFDLLELRQESSGIGDITKAFFTKEDGSVTEVDITDVNLW